MKEYDVKVRYAFEGTYTVAAENCDEAKRMVSEDCGLVLGSNIHTTRDNEEVLGARNIDWLHEMYDAVWRQLEGGKNVESEIEKS